MDKEKFTIHDIVKGLEGFVTRHDLLFKSIFSIFLLLFVALHPALIEGDISSRIPDPHHDLGVYQEKDALLSNRSTMKESNEIAGIANETLDVSIYDDTDQIENWDGFSDIMSIETLTVPRMERPPILEKAQDFGVESILDTILDGRSYYIYANCSENPDGIWVTSDSVSDPLKRPVIHARLVTDIIEVEPLEPTPVDIDGDGVDDIEVELLIEANVDGGLSSILNDPLGAIPIPSLPVLPELGDNPPRVRITNPPTNFWVVGRSLVSDTWQIAGWTWEFDLEFDSPEIEKVVVSIDENDENADWQEATLTNIIDPLPSWPLRSWYKWYFNWDLSEVENGLHTIYVRAYEGDEYTEDSVKVYVSNPVYKGVRLLVKIDRINDDFNQTSEVNIIRPVAHGEGQYIWALGMYFENFSQHFTAYLSPNAISFSEHLPSIGSSLLEGLLVEYIEGPYSIGWNATSVPLGLRVCFSHAGIESSGGDNLKEATWLKLDFEGSSPPKKAEINFAFNATLEVGSNIHADASRLEWHGDRVTNLSLIYHDEREKETTHLLARVQGMPTDFIISLENQSSIKPYEVYTSLHFDSSDNIEKLTLNVYTFEDEKLRIGLGVNISDLPKSFYFNGTYSALSIQSPSILGIGGSYMWPYLWDVVSMYIGRILAQIAERVASLPSRVLKKDLLEGEYVLNVLDGKRIGGLEFFITNGEYPLLEGNYLCFCNASDSNITITGRLCGISGFSARSNATGIRFEAYLSTSEELRLINLHAIDSKDFESFYLSNVPSELLIELNSTYINYTASEHVDRFEFLSNRSGLHIFARITDMPKRLIFIQNESEMMLEVFDEEIAVIEFVVTDSKAMSTDGNYLMIMKESDMSMASGRISEVKRLYYSNTDQLTLNFSLKGGDQFRIVGRIDTQDMEETLVVDAVINNIPEELELSVPNDRLTSSLGVLDIRSLKGLQDVTGTLSSITKIGEAVLDLMLNITEVFTTELNTIVKGASFSYSLKEESNLDIIARIEFGDVSQVKDCIWTHGVSARSGPDGSLCARIFLTGLPQRAEIGVNLLGDKSDVDFFIENFSPRYDWLLLDVQIIEGMDILFYVDDINGKIERIELKSKFEINPHATTSEVTFSAESENGLGKVLLQGGINNPYPLKIEMFVSNVPKSLETEVSVKNDVALNYSASKSIEHLMLNVSKFIDDVWYEGTIIAGDIPTHINIAFEADTKYREDTPLLGMPSVNVTTDSDTLDLYLKLDGRIFGRRGNYEFHVEDIKSGLTARLEGDAYKVRAQDSESFSMVVRDLPLMPMYDLKALKLHVKGLKSIDLRVLLVADLYPVIQLENTDVEDLKIALSHDIDILGAKFSPNLVMSETTFTESDNPKLFIIYKSPTHINGMSTTLKDDRTVMILPNILATLVASFALIFIVILALLLLLWVGVRIFGQRFDDIKQYEEDGSSDERHNQKEAKRKKNNKEIRKKFTKHKKIAAVVILMILLGGVLYYLLIPWVELKVETEFTETVSGVFVSCELTNTGTVLIEDLNASFNVYNSTNVLMGNATFSDSLIRRWEHAGGFVHYFGDQFEPYKIEITVYFKAGGKGYRSTFEHVAKDHMRLAFEDRMP